MADKPDAYVAFIRGSSGGDPELLAVYDRTRTAFTLRVLDGLGLLDPAATPAAWPCGAGSAFTEEVTVDWLAQRGPRPGPRWSTCSTTPWSRW